MANSDNDDAHRKQRKAATDAAKYRRNVASGKQEVYKSNKNTSNRAVGGFYHVKTRLSLIQCISVRVTSFHLNHSRPRLAKEYHNLFNDITFELLTMDPELAKSLLPSVMMISSEFFTTSTNGPLGNKTTKPIMESARDCSHRFILLLSAHDPQRFAFVIDHICEGILGTDKPTQKEGCANSLALAVEIAPRNIIQDFQQGIGSRKTKSKLSRACIDLLTGRIGSEYVRKAGKMLYHRLKANGYCDIAAEIVKGGKLSKSEKTYLYRAKAAAEEDWEKTGAKWLRNNGHGH